MTVYIIGMFILPVDFCRCEEHLCCYTVSTTVLCTCVSRRMVVCRVAQEAGAPHP